MLEKTTWISFFLGILILLFTANRLKMLFTATPGEEENIPAVKSALLYQILEDDSNCAKLYYNVVYSADLPADAAVSGCGVESISALEEILGIADLPDTVTGTTVTGRTLGKAVTADLYTDVNGAITEITVTAISDRPVIGLSWKSNNIPEKYIHMAKGFERNGAYIVYLPQVSTEEEARQVLEQIDGIVMTGGADPNPACYNQHQTPHGAVKWSNARDASDLLLIRQAIPMNIPLLAICRGEQMLNVALGGSLIQDIPCYLGSQVASGKIPLHRVTSVLSGTLPGSDTAVPDTGYLRYNKSGKRMGNTYDPDTNIYQKGSGCAEGHLRVEIDGLSHNSETNYHVLTPTPESRAYTIDPSSKWLAGIVGDTQIAHVTTSHHQAVDPEALGEGLTVAAYASDGIVEAVEYRDNSFVLGLQWHPEKDALGDIGPVAADEDLSNALLRSVIDYAHAYRNGKRS